MNGVEKKQFLTFGIAGHIVAAIAISFAVYGYVMAQVDVKIESSVEQLKTTVINNKEEIFYLAKKWSLYELLDLALSVLKETMALKLWQK